MARKYRTVTRPRNPAPPISAWLGCNYSRDNHPATAARDYSGEEWEFIKAMDRLKASLGRMPTIPEVLDRAKSLGYLKSAVCVGIG